MLRLTFGLGYSSADLSSPADLAYSGFSDSLSFDIGAALSENWTLHVRFSQLSMVAPAVTVNGNDLADIEGAELTSYLSGLAVTYNFMPANLYLTLALGFSWVSEETETTENTSDTGFGANLDFGKEWWVSDNWGVGITGRFWLTYVDDSDVLRDTTYSMFGFAGLFSATYN